MSDLPADQDRPLSLFGAFGWASCAIVLMAFAFAVSRALRPGLATDLVNANICTAFAFSCVAYGVVRLHLPMRTVVDALALRPVGVLLLLLAVGAGFGTLVAASWASSLVDHRWPLPEAEIQSLQEAYTFHGTLHRAAFAFATTALGPITEEMFFRGALFRALRRTFSPAVTVLLTAILFAFCHLSPRHVVHVFPAGLVLGALRASTGSLVAPLLAHMTFNAVTTFQLLSGRVNLTEPEPLVPWWQGLAGLGGTVAALLLTYGLHRRAERARAASEGAP